MKPQFVPETEMGRRRHAWFNERATMGMTMAEYVRLNEAALQLFPLSEEERRLKSESLTAMPEFVL